MWVLTAPIVAVYNAMYVENGLVGENTFLEITIISSELS
jgi:hypothetical protein